jgi:hypothetical protein
MKEELGRIRWIAVMYTFEQNEIKVGRNFMEGQLFRDYDGARFFSYYNNKSAWEGRKMIYYYLGVVCRFHERRYFIDTSIEAKHRYSRSQSPGFDIIRIIRIKYASILTYPNRHHSWSPSLQYVYL